MGESAKPAPPPLEARREAFVRNRFLAMPIAGTIAWAAIEVAVALLPLEQAAWSVLIGTGMKRPKDTSARTLRSTWSRVVR